jgi:hypothetical protein
MAKRQLLSPADDTASLVLVDIQTATTRVKEIVSEGVAKGWTDKELTKALNKAIAEECNKIDISYRESFRKSLVSSARKWHYQLLQSYRVLDRNLQQEIAKQPLNVELFNLSKKTPYEKQIEFRRILDDGTNPGIPVIKDYQKSVRLVARALASDAVKLKTEGKRFMPARLRAELAVRYAAAVENLQRLIDDGVKFCWISSHANCSPRCRSFQGKLYSLFQGKVTIDGKEYGEKGTIDGIPYRPINEALAGPNGDGNGCISGYGCRHRAIEYERGSRPPADFTKAEMQKEYGIDKKQRAYENRIRQLKTEERELRAQGDIEKANQLRKKWRRLTKDYQIYSIENNRAYYPYRYVIDREEDTSLEAEKIEHNPFVEPNSAPENYDQNYKVDYENEYRGTVSYTTAGQVYKANKNGNIEVLPETISMLYDDANDRSPMAVKRNKYSQNWYWYYDPLDKLTNALLNKDYNVAQILINRLEYHLISHAGKKSRFFKYQKDLKDKPSWWANE